MGDRALAVTDITAAQGFYDYHAKYAEGGSAHVIPAAVHPTTYAAALDIALRAHQALGCRGATRSDFRYDDTHGEPGRLVLLEVNTQPGLTPTSLLPEQAAYIRIVLPRAVRLDGGARRMSRVTRPPIRETIRQPRDVAARPTRRSCCCAGAGASSARPCSARPASASC